MRGQWTWHLFTEASSEGLNRDKCGTRRGHKEGGGVRAYNKGKLTSKELKAGHGAVSDECPLLCGQKR